MDSKLKNWFESKDKFQLKSVNNDASIKTNFYLMQSNFETIRFWFTQCKDYLRYLTETIDVNGLIDKILKSIETDRLSFDLDPSQIQADEKNVVIGKRQFAIVRVSEVEWLIGGDAKEFNSSKLFVGVKSKATGQILYPSIFTVDNEIRILFDPFTEITETLSVSVF